MGNMNFKTKSYEIKYFNKKPNAFQWAILNTILYFENEEISLINILENHLKIENNRKILNVIIKELVNKGIIKNLNLEKDKELCDIKINKISFNKEELEKFLFDTEFNHNKDKENNNIFFIEFKALSKSNNIAKSLNGKADIKFFNNNEFSEKILTIVINKNLEDEIFIVNYDSKNKEIKLNIDYRCDDLQEFLVVVYSVIEKIYENNITENFSVEMVNQLKRLKELINQIEKIEKEIEEIEKRYCLDEKNLKEKIQKMNFDRNEEEIDNTLDLLDKIRQNYRKLKGKISSINEITNNIYKPIKYNEKIKNIEMYRDELENISDGFL